MLSIQERRMKRTSQSLLIKHSLIFDLNLVTKSSFFEQCLESLMCSSKERDFGLRIFHFLLLFRLSLNFLFKLQWKASFHALLLVSFLVINFFLFFLGTLFFNFIFYIFLSFLLLFFFTPLSVYQFLPANLDRLCQTLLCRLDLFLISSVQF